MMGILRSCAVLWVMLLNCHGADVVQSSAAHDDYEASQIDWLSPQECIAKYAEGVVALPPPQVQMCSLQRLLVSLHVCCNCANACYWNAGLLLCCSGCSCMN